MYSHDIYNMQKQLGHANQVDSADPAVLQARNILEECSNYQECKQLALRNRECILYFTQEVHEALRNIPQRAIDQVVNDGTVHGMQRYVLQVGQETHEFWVLKKYYATLLHEHFTTYSTVAPYVYSTRKYGAAYFAKRTAAALCCTAIFSMALVCAIMLSSEIASWAAAGVCMFVAGINFALLLKLYRKYTHNPRSSACAVAELLAHEHGIPHVMFTTDDTSEVI